MILEGNQRGGAKNLADHLLSPENEMAEVHSLRGFTADDLHGALTEAYAVSRGTRCKQFLYSLSLNPPPDAQVETRVFEAAIERIEKELGLEGQPRAIVFHEKAGADGITRRHAHAVWSRIDTEEMKAIPLPFTKLKLRDLSRDLFIEHDWRMPRGYIDKAARDPKKYTLAEWQQAKRAGKHPNDIKRAFQDAWALSDSRAAFEKALAERGYVLAKGDRRGFVGVDERGEIYSVPRMLGLKTKAVRERLGAEIALPGVAEAKNQIAQGMLEALKGYRQELAQQRREALERLKARKAELLARQRAERRALTAKQEARQIIEARQRQARFRKGVMGLWDRITGRHAKIKTQNIAEAEAAAARDALEKDRLVFRQIGERRRLQRTFMHWREKFMETRRDLRADFERYKSMAAEYRQAASKRQKTQDAPQRALARRGGLER